VILNTDSLSCLASLASAGARDQRELFLTRQITELATKTVEVRLKWVRGHSGCFGNEVVDRAAAALTRHCNTSNRFRQHIGKHPARAAMKAHAKNKQKTAFMYDGASTAAWLRNVTNDSLSPNPLLNGLTGEIGRETQEAYNAIRLNVLSSSGRWQHMIGASETDACGRCGGLHDDMAHLFFHCDALRERQVRMRERIRESQQRADDERVAKGLKPKRKNTCCPLSFIHEFPREVCMFLEEAGVKPYPTSAGAKPSDDTREGGLNENGEVGRRAKFAFTDEERAVVALWTKPKNRGGGEPKTTSNCDEEHFSAPEQEAGRQRKQQKRGTKGSGGARGKGRFHNSYERLRGLLAPDLPAGAWQPRKQNGGQPRVTREQALPQQAAGASLGF
jgi:hypothetical protein